MTATTNVAGMVRRKRYRPSGPIWPSHWDVSFEWKHGRTILTTRKFDVQVKGNRGWFTFDRFVCNTETNTCWIDCFEQYPQGGYVSYRPEKVTRVRAHIEPSKRAGNASGIRGLEEESDNSK